MFAASMMLIVSKMFNFYQNQLAGDDSEAWSTICLLPHGCFGGVHTEPCQHTFVPEWESVFVILARAATKEEYSPDHNCSVGDGHGKLHIDPTKEAGILFAYVCL